MKKQILLWLSDKLELFQTIFLLIKVRLMLQRGWSPKHGALDYRGNPTSPTSRYVRSFGIIPALCVASNNKVKLQNRSFHLVQRAIEDDEHFAVHRFESSPQRTQIEVLAMIDKTILLSLKSKS